MSTPQLEIAQCGPPWSESDLDCLAEVLHACVHTGASAGFVAPFSLDDSRAWWHCRVVPQVEAGTRHLLIARMDGRIVGTVQLITDTMPNQRHRGEVAKLLVHPEARRGGIARVLMNAVEELAREEGRTLLTLDTRTGDHAEPLYLSMGYVAVGAIPGYARDVFSPALDATTIMYKQLP